MNQPVLNRFLCFGKRGNCVDERFLEHRRRSSSIAGFAALILAACIFEYRLIFNQIVSWDLVAIILAFAVVKTSLCTWYRFKN